MKNWSVISRMLRVGVLASSRKTAIRACRCLVSSKIIAFTLQPSLYHVPCMLLKYSDYGYCFHPRCCRFDDAKVCESWKNRKFSFPSDFSYKWRTDSSKFFFSFGFSNKREIPFVSKKWYLNARSANCTQVRARDISASETGWGGASTEILSVPRKFCEGRTYWSTLKVDERYNGVFTTALTVFPVIK